MSDLVTLLVPIATALGVCYFFLNRSTTELLIATVWSSLWILLVVGGGMPEYIIGEYNASALDRAPVFSVTLLDATDTVYSHLVLALDGCLFVGLLLLGLATIRYRGNGHLLAAVGWQLFGIYWLFQIPRNLAINDLVNVMFISGGFALFTVLSYHEILSRRWGERLAALRFIAAASSLTGGLYFAIAKIHVIGTPLIQTVAFQTTMLANFLFGYQTGLEAPPYPVSFEDGVIIPVSGMTGGTDIALVLACTGIEAIALFLGAILAAPYESDPWEGWRKVPARVERLWRPLGTRGRLLFALLVTSPVIYLLNLLRNVAIINLLEEHTFAGVAVSLGYTEFEFIHGILFKIFALVVLIGMSLIIFDVIPELHGAVVGLFRLVDRRPLASTTTSLAQRTGSVVPKPRKMKGTPARANADDSEE